LKNNYLKAQFRLKRKPEDLEALIKDDEIMTYIICEICTLKEKCAKPFCQYCTKCVSNENGKISISLKKPISIPL
jgi:hypothetical protein